MVDDILLRLLLLLKFRNSTCNKERALLNHMLRTLYSILLPCCIIVK
uniref:Uncharacterized protein n=1 Tax=Rhizophora mucronata TaxID=61149 RepID=A0A2P2J2Y7_RHIMU